MGKCMLNDRVDETRVMKNGMEATIINYRGFHDIDIEFKNGKVVYHKDYDRFKSGMIKCPMVIKDFGIIM